MSMKFKALVIREEANGLFSKNIELKTLEQLPEGDLVLRVHFAALNYKDSLSASGHRGITKNYPHTPGIDAVGTVVSSQNPDFKTDDWVIVTSYDLGMNTSGAFQQYIRVPSQWAVPLPQGMSPVEAMTHGSAGYTAALALHKMEACGQTPAMGRILVTGASGGVGSLALAILAKAGYNTLATTRKKDAEPYLKALGATEVADSSIANNTSDKPIMKPLWAGAIDTVGDTTLTTCLRACGRNGSVACTGLVQSPNFAMTVYPFILNGVNLLGIDSAETPMPLRRQLWQKLATDWRITPLIDTITQVIELEDLPAQIDAIGQGLVKGRIVVRL